MKLLAREAFRLLIGKKLYRYAIVGVGSNLAAYIVFVAFIWLEMPTSLAAGLCYGIGLIISYTFNRRWSFESTAGHSKDLAKFLFAYGMGLVATLAFITILTMFLRPEIAQILNIGLTAMVIFALLRLTGFGDGDR